MLSEGAADARESAGTPGDMEAGGTPQNIDAEGPVPRPAEDTDADVQQDLEHIDKMLAEEADVEYSDVE